MFKRIHNFVTLNVKKNFYVYVEKVVDIFAIVCYTYIVKKNKQPQKEVKCMMEIGKRSLENIKKNFSIIDSYLNFDLMEHNNLGEEMIICVNFKSNTYCYTCEDLMYTIENRSEFEWYKMKEK